MIVTLVGLQGRWDSGSLGLGVIVCLPCGDVATGTPKMPVILLSHLPP